jgi:hypothetical protein
VLYGLVLLIHSWLRWAVLLAGLVAAARGIAGWRGGRPWTLSDDRAGWWFLTSLDVQMLLGLLLYFGLSPITSAALGDFGAAMSNSGLRFWAVEHVFGMIVGIALAHIGRARIRRAGQQGNDPRRHRLAAVFFTLALIAIIASIPWPGTPNGRPLGRW